MRRVDWARRIAVLLGLGMLSCALCLDLAAQESAAVQMPSPDTTPSLPDAPADLSAPLRVGRYTRGEARDYGSPMGGVSYQYGNGRTRLTVYFYARDTAWHALEVTEALKREVGRFKQVLEIQRRRGRWDDYEIAFEGPDSVQVGHTVVPGRQLGVGIRRGKAVYVSLLYLYAVGDEWIKVRGTVSASEWQQTDIPVFARQVSVMSISRPPED